MDIRIIISVLRATLRQSTPITLGALGGIFSERSGVVNIAIEGMMLSAAFAGFMVNVYTGNLFFAVIGAMIVGGLMGLIHAWLSITFKIDQIISGTVINILAIGLTGYFYQSGATTKGKLSPIPIPILSDIPVIGEVLFNNPPITYTAIVMVFVTAFIMFRTTWGLRTRAVGEHPHAADTVGINVYLVRYINVIISGAVAGLGGAFLTLESVGSFERGITNGRGFIALAALIFGKWNPYGAWGAALLFGFANAIQTQLQFTGGLNVPHEFIGMIPYVLTVLVLAGFVGKARPPAAVGQPYDGHLSLKEIFNDISKMFKTKSPEIS
ncbi:MAG: ABC transporter permease [Anaerolineaceae bacterium 4572_78]|nr:MAG: ABC transporter permease [Anaerolineaceae bacterium 4572_78]